MNKFKQFWQKHTTHETFDADGKETDSYEGEDFDEKKSEKQITHERQGQEEHVDKEGGGFQKPGESVHTAKWDKCVSEVKASSPDADPFAVCTAQLGEESFKSEHRHKAYIKAEIVKAQKKIGKFGVVNAGPVPNTLLARQDLEDEACDSEEAIRDGEGFELKQ